MLFIDLPTTSEFMDLRRKTADACVSLYLPTTPLSQEAEASRIEFSHQLKGAQAQLEASGFDKRRLLSLIEHIQDLVDDDEFWRLQANSLAVLATPDMVRTYRLANRLTPMTMVSDRFHLNPLLRALTFSNAAFVLAVSENAVRLVEVYPNLAPAEVKVPNLPRDAASAVHKATLNNRAPSGRIQGAEGQNVRLRQYARRIDAALRPVLAGRNIPLILAAADRMASIYRTVNSYPNLLEEHVSNVTDRSTNDELANATRDVLDRANAAEIVDLNGLFDQRAGQGRATADLSDVARAATYGAIDTLMVDFESETPGLIDVETGALELADAPSAETYDVLDEISGRTLTHGGRVLSVRASDMPTEAPVAALLRYPV